jgi:hypothetical protein
MVLFGLRPTGVCLSLPIINGLITQNKILRMRIFITTILLAFLTIPVFSQTQNDTLFCYHTKTPVTIDGQATEACWENAEWNAIDQVWIPWGTSMKDGDFSGRFKVTWDEDFLYVLVEVVDDSLSDDYSNPLEKWWEDDCLEIFIDENRSMGDHTTNNNAFAYHVSLFYDAIDLSVSGGGINYKNNLVVDMDTIAENTYLWEFAFKNYAATFSLSNPERSRVKLSHNKHMGLAVAYCDNDETKTRENFIGSMVMTQAQHNDMYKNADHFGLMILIDPDQVATNTNDFSNQSDFRIYPVPAKDYLTISNKSSEHLPTFVTISSLTGQVMKSESFFGSTHQFNIEAFKTGIYIVKVVNGKNSVTKKILKQ